MSMNDGLVKDSTLFIVISSEGDPGVHTDISLIIQNLEPYFN
jgi:hypothetical protein